MRKAFMLGAALVASVLTGSVASAITIAGSGSLGSFTGTFEYTQTDESSGVVDVTLNNTSATVGYITGFAFNIPDTASVSAVVLTAPNVHYSALGGLSFDNEVNGQPHGIFDIGAALGGSYEGGGDPHDGIVTGSLGSFSFALTGAGLDTVSAADFLSTLSAAQNQDHVEDFVVRFRGFSAEPSSDKVPNTLGDPIPEPGTVTLLGLGLASLSAARRRARNR